MTAPPAPLHTFGEIAVIIDHTTTHRPFSSREFIFRVRAPSKDSSLVKVYRIEILDAEIADMTERQIAEFLLRGPRRKSLLFTYREP
ncbi:MAG TPA: hypothetical protein VNY80_08030 [Steroidobacteraceae bacterium]|nr:hypothetical protein [Steroidobacteraceae bacterium]